MLNTRALVISMEKVYGMKEKSWIESSTNKCTCCHIEARFSRLYLIHSL